MPKVFTDLRAGETMNAESDLLSFSSIIASPVHPLSVDCAGELKVGGANAFYTPGGRLSVMLRPRPRALLFPNLNRTSTACITP